jgi:hypothetical protein
MNTKFQTLGKPVIAVLGAGHGDMAMAGHLAMKPHILHVVGFSEGDHATGYEELIESCKIVHGVIQNGLKGLPDFMADPLIQARKEQLKADSGLILDALTFIGSDADDPHSNPKTIAKAIETGILDAPHFRGNPFLKGDILTRNINGAWYAINPSTGEPIEEKSRLAEILLNEKTKSNLKK